MNEIRPKQNLDKIVEKMENLNFRNQTAWFQFFQFLKQIEEGELYKEGLPIESASGQILYYITDSFSDWIGAFCKYTHKISRSRVREITRAGQILEKFLRKNNLTLEDLNIIPAPQTLINIQNIVSREKERGAIKNQEERMEYYIHQAISGKLSRDDSRKKLREERIKNEATEELEPLNNSVQRLVQDGSWLGGKKWREGIYKGFTNFSSLPEENVVIFENLSNPEEIACHLILTAADKNSLRESIAEIKKKKLQSQFDYLWLLEGNLISDEEIPEEIGIIKYSPKSIDRLKTAKKMEADTLWAYQEYIRKVH